MKKDEMLKKKMIEAIINLLNLKQILPLFLILILSTFWFDFIPKVNATPTFSNASWDFGTVSSPVQQGWIGVTGSDLYSESVGWGWNATLSDVDRGSGSGGFYNNVERDMCWAGNVNPREFKIHVVCNGIYNIQVWIGDNGYAHGNQYIYAEGVKLQEHIDVVSMVWKVYNVSIIVKDSYLELTFGKDSPYGNPNWVVNGVKITYISIIYDEFNDLSHWTVYKDTPFISTWYGNALTLNTSQTWVTGNYFGQYNTMPAIYLSSPSTANFANGSIEFDLRTPKYGPGDQGYGQPDEANATVGSGYSFILSVNFRMQDEKNYYSFLIQWGSTYGATANDWNWRFAKVVNGQLSYIGSYFNQIMAKDTWYHIRIVINGTMFWASTPDTHRDAKVCLVENENTWSHGAWGGISMHLMYDPVSYLLIDNFTVSTTVPYGGGKSYYVDTVCVSTNEWVDWYMTQYLWDRYNSYFTNKVTFAEMFCAKATAWMGWDFGSAGHHYLGNYTSPLGKKIALWVYQGGLGAYCSSGHDGYRPPWATQDTPHIGIGLDAFTYSCGAGWLAHGQNVQGYYALIFFAHEYMNMFNFFSCVNVPYWYCDGHSPFAFEIKTIPMIQAGNTIGGTFGRDIIDIANYESALGQAGDVGCRAIHQWLSLYPNFFQRTYNAFRKERMCFGWTIYNNASGDYPIITDTALRSAYIQMYMEYGAGAELDWSWSYIPASENNKILRTQLHTVHDLIVACQDMIQTYTDQGNNPTTFNNQLETAMERWRKGYYADALPLIDALYDALTALGLKSLLRVDTFKNYVPILSNLTLFYENKTVIETVKNVNSNVWFLSPGTYYVQASILYNKYAYNSEQIKVSLSLPGVTTIVINFLFSNLTLTCLDIKNQPLKNCTVIFTRGEEKRISSTNSSGSTFLEAYYGNWTIRAYWMGVPVLEQNFSINELEVKIDAQCNVGDFTVQVLNQYGKLIKSNVTLTNATYSLSFRGYLDGIMKDLTFTQIPLIKYILTIKDDFVTKTDSVDAKQTRGVYTEVIELNLLWIERIVFTLIGLILGSIVAWAIIKRGRKRTQLS